MHRPLLRRLAVLIAAGFVLAACGGGDGDDGAQLPDVLDQDGNLATESSEDDEGPWPPKEMPGTGELGTVTVDGAEYPVDAMRLCDVTDFDAGDDRTREFEVQGTGAIDPEDEFEEHYELSVFTGVKENPDADTQGLDWDGPEGLYKGYETGDDQPLDVSADRITGTMSLRSALGNPSVETTVDIALPDTEAVDCSN